VKTILTKPTSPDGIQAEVRQLRATARRIVGNKRLARRFLAATGMYTPNGNLKPQFR